MNFHYTCWSAPMSLGGPHVIFDHDFVTYPAWKLWANVVILGSRFKCILEKFSDILLQHVMVPYKLNGLEQRTHPSHYLCTFETPLFGFFIYSYSDHSMSASMWSVEIWDFISCEIHRVLAQFRLTSGKLSKMGHLQISQNTTKTISLTISLREPCLWVDPS